MTHDAGRLREELATELAEWRTTGYWSPDRAERFRRRLAILARLVGKSREAVYRDLGRDVLTRTHGRD